MLFFINFALGACSGEYIGARFRNASSQPARHLGVRRGKYIGARSITPHLAGAPLCSAPRRVYWSIYQRSARMGLCRKSS